MTSASSPLLEMKVYVPRSQGGLVPRPRLTERLDRGAESKLLLVSAPAGFGKTTLLAEWVAEAPGARSTAWLSLDHDDNDPTTFWRYLIAALRTVAPDAGANALTLLQAQQAPPIQTTLTTLINDLGEAQGEIVLVLDDYHVIDTHEIHEGMTYLLDHLPSRLHLVLAGRSDPPLPLARLRARGQLVETRAADLRFTPDEAVAYLNGSMGLQLTPEDVAALEGRTEGWIAALQLAALSMQGREDAEQFIAGFAGDDRYVVDYLVEEVLQRQSESTQSFLLQTSILGRLSAPLCDAVTDRRDGKVVLEALDRGNLFLVPLDERRHWYRYHRLFADVLNARLLEDRPDQLSELHLRASAWYEQNGRVSEAVSHALAAKDFTRAADLVERALPTIRQHRQEVTALGWLRAIPESVIRCRPVLTVHYAGALLLTGQLAGVEERLREAERWLEPTDPLSEKPGPTDVMVVVDDAEFRAVPSLIALYRAALALAGSDLEATITNAERALALVAADNYLIRGAAAGLLGLAHWTRGDLEAGHRMYAECTANLERAGHIADTLGCAIALADIRLAQGRPRDAMRTYETALQLASAQAGPVLRGTADVFIGMSELHLERDDVERAIQDLARSQELGEHTGLPQSQYRGRVAGARIQEAQGDLEGALTLLDEAERLYVGDFFPNVRPIPALRARVLVKQGNVDAGLLWAREQGLSVDDDLAYVREFEHITLARILLAANDPEGHLREQATTLLQRLLEAAEAGERTGSVIEILIQQALAFRPQGNLQDALVPLERVPHAGRA